MTTWQATRNIASRRIDARGDAYNHYREVDVAVSVNLEYINISVLFSWIWLVESITY